MNRGTLGVPGPTGVAQATDVSASAAAYRLRRYGEQLAYVPSGGKFATSRGPLWNPLLSAFNAHAGNLVNWRRAVGAARAGSADAVLCVVGDSTSTGRGDDVNKHAHSWPICLQSLLLSYRLPNTSYEAGWGDHGGANGEGLASYDARFGAPGSGWSVENGFDSGGGGFVATNAAVGALTFTPTISFDTVRVWTLYNTTNFGQVTVKVDGSSVGNTTTRTTSIGVQSDSFTTTLGTHIITLTDPTGGSNGSQHVYGIDVWDSSKKGARVFMKSRGGSKVADHVVGSFDVRSQMAPALTIVNLTINDVDTAAPGETALGSYRASLQSIINTAKLTGDCLLMTGNWNNWGNALGAYGRSEPYHEAHYELAYTNDLPLFDLRHRWPSYATQGATGSGGVPALGGTLHPAAAGYQDIAQAVYNIIST